MTVEDAVRELAQVVAGHKDEGSEEETTYIEAPANPQDGDTLVYDESEGKWVAGGSGGDGAVYLKVTEVNDKDTVPASYSDIMGFIDEKKSVFICNEMEGEGFHHLRITPISVIAYASEGFGYGIMILERSGDGTMKEVVYRADTDSENLVLLQLG